MMPSTLKFKMNIGSDEKLEIIFQINIKQG